MFRVQWQMSDGTRREHYCSTRAEAAATFNNVLDGQGVVRLLAYERYGSGDKTGWRLLKIGSDGEAVHENED